MNELRFTCIFLLPLVYKSDKFNFYKSMEYYIIHLLIQKFNKIWTCKLFRTKKNWYKFYFFKLYYYLVYFNKLQAYIQ